MAKATFNFPFSGSLGDYSVYHQRGSDKLIIRSKGGASKERIKSDPSFERVRLNNTEFSGCGKTAGNILTALKGIKHLADHNIAGSLVRIVKLIQKMDTSHLTGERSIMISRYKNILTGFNLNLKNVFDTVVIYNPEYFISRKELMVRLFFPELFPQIHLSPPWDFGWYRFIVVLGIVPDMMLTESGYQLTNGQTVYNPVKCSTEWQSTEFSIPANTVTLNLTENDALDDNASMVLSIGIEFGRMLTNSIIQPVKSAGCAKILGVG
jgi:hypothetical protein